MVAKSSQLLFLLVLLAAVSSQQCSPLCGYCDTSSGAASCTFCYYDFTNSSDAYNPDAGSACNCPVGMYLNATTHLCDFCDVRCKSCTSLSTCTECLEDFAWNITSGRCEVATRYTYRIA